MQWHWTNHARYKMRYYRLSEQMVRGVIARPKRVEEGIAPETVAYMKQAGSAKRPHEIWVMVAKQIKNEKLKVKKFSRRSSAMSRIELHSGAGINGQMSDVLRVISAWRYPGITKPGKPLPREILNEIQEAI